MKNTRIRDKSFLFPASFKMSPEMTCERTTNTDAAAAAMERFGSRGMALLPWTKQMLVVLWEHLWLLVRVIYCTFLSVFQMFRFEVYFGITDEIGQHIPHGQTPSFLFSSLIEGDDNMMVGHPDDLSDSGKATAEALLSGLAPDDGVYVGFRGDWNIFPAFSTEALFKEGDCDSTEFNPEMWDDPYGQSSKNMADEMSGLRMWVRRSDSDTSWSSSEVSAADLEENERLLEFFSRPDDPYNPMCFTACTISKAPMCTDVHLTPSSNDEEALWRSLDQKDDPYHPLNFQAPLSDRQPQHVPQPLKVTPTKCTETLKKHTQRSRFGSQDVIRVPWKRPAQRHQLPERHSPHAQKKVRFSPVVEVHVMWAWHFATAASRKGPWEEMARDRERFRRRVDEAERAIGYCFNAAHRARMREYVDTRWNTG
ncbi:protein phosphatase 1 regulatory subunit 15B [Corythoichthys intestinalis]|uniref:protein phosphatase 1 regulatory subunit 15B n=1 Tax=Corythoichthys intestinalis TaxID=161448 RepID=UPI0025A64E2C|nr:protein phosphatase 1 regulatory subunit 15B [Corythoichthys intestinalis]